FRHVTVMISHWIGIDMCPGGRRFFILQIQEEINQSLRAVPIRAANTGKNSQFNRVTVRFRADMDKTINPLGATFCRRLNRAMIKPSTLGRSEFQGLEEPEVTGFWR